MDIYDGLLQFFNVDHGACSLLTLPTQSGYKNVLIDCGHSTNYQGHSWYPGEYLFHHGIRHIDLLIITNYDEDHVSGLPSLIKRGITVETILGNPSVGPNTIRHLKSKHGMGPGIEIVANSLSDRIQKGTHTPPPIIPGLDLSWAWNTWPHWDTENDLSLVAHLNIRGINFLFPGDMERSGFENLLGNQQFSALMRGVNVLVAPHHGRENGKCPILFDVHSCNPDLVVISDCSKKFQSQETVPYYRSKAKGISGFRNHGTKYVLTTRSDDYFYFSFQGGKCLVF